MPELPEVETIRRGLSEKIIGKVIREVKVYSEKNFVLGELETGGVIRAKNLEERRVEGLRRFGKAMVVDLSGGASLIIHLRMTGQLVFRGSSDEDLVAGGHPSEDWLDKLPNKHTRVEIEFKDGERLFFNDQRKFGFIKTAETGRVEEDEFIRRLGKEPWEMTGEELFSKLQRRKVAKIKTVLLDQSVMAGLGNIYADEALFYAGVRPERVAGEVSEKEAGRLVEGARVVMERSLGAGGSSLKNYVKADGTRGDYLDLFAKVYGRGGKECERCGGRIKKIKVGGRGTHYCSECQK